MNKLAVFVAGMLTGAVALGAAAMLVDDLAAGQEAIRDDDEDEGLVIDTQAWTEPSASRPAA